MSNELHLLCWQKVLFSSVQSLIRVQIFATHGLQHAKLPRPSPTPGACSNWCLLSQWCHPTISSSVVPFSSCLQSFPASGSFSMNRLFASGGQSIGASDSASVLPVNIYYMPVSKKEVDTANRMRTGTCLEKKKRKTTKTLPPTTKAVAIMFL